MFPYLMIPSWLEATVGSVDTGTRMYRSKGSDHDVGPWFEAICRHFSEDSFVSPGVVRMFAPVSRAAVHKRLIEGKLTAFCFSVIKAEELTFRHQRKLKQLPYVFIPVSECKAWGAELRTRSGRGKQSNGAVVTAGIQRGWEPEFLD